MILLTKQLRSFEAKGLVSRKLYPEVPPRVEYQITVLGQTLQPALHALAEWMKEHSNSLE